MNGDTGSGPLQVVLLIPVFNDWDSLQSLLPQIGAIAAQTTNAFSLVVVDDGSSQPMPQSLLAQSENHRLQLIEAIHLHRNIGHQGALAVGLSEIHRRHECDLVIVMDADGEDRPEDLERFLRAHAESPNSIIVAKRSRRSEGLWFRALYGLYKLIFRLFVGRGLDYGNYCLIPRSLLGRVAYDPMSWNHLAAAIARSGVDVVRIDSDRGKRLSGESSMGLERLISHGLSAVSVFLDVAMIRVLIVSAVIVFFALAGVLTVIWLRLFTDLAIPGWATSTVGLLSIMGLQGLILSTIASFLILRSRSAVSMIPAFDASKFIERIERANAGE